MNIEIDQQTLRGPFAYRYYDQMYCSVSISPSGSESYYSTGPVTELMEIPILSFTEKGFWIPDYRNTHIFGKPAQRWIGNHWRKKYAHLSKVEALKSFKARKRRQITIYKRRLELAQSALSSADLVAI